MNYKCTYLLICNEATCSLSSHESEKALGELLIQGLWLADLNQNCTWLCPGSVIAKHCLQSTAEDSLCASRWP